MGLIAARVLKPDRKLAPRTAWDAHTSSDPLNEELELELNRVEADDLYETLDYLVERQTALGRRLAKRPPREGSMVLCDVTSRYVEGAPNERAAFGYNRDHKKGKKPIVFGRLTDQKGCPVAEEVFKGHTGDPATVAAPVAQLQQCFQLKQIGLVGDRGLLTNARIREDLRPHKIGWISALRRD